MLNNTKKFKIFLIGLGFILSGLATDLWAASKSGAVAKGNNFYSKGDYASSIKKYEEALRSDPESDILNYNLGTAYYKNNDYLKAIDHLNKAILSNREDLKANAHFNIGNALFKQGISHEQDDIDQAIKLLEQSLQHYENLVNQDPKPQDAQANYEFVKKELERLRKKQEQQNQQENQKQDQDKKDQQNQAQQQKNQSDQQNQPQNQSQGEQNQSGQENQQSQQNQQNQQDQANNQQKDRQENAQQTEQSVQNSPKDSGQKSSAQYNNILNENKEDKEKVKDVSREEAKRLLENFEQNEQPKGLLNVFHKKNQEDQPVVKDW